MRRQSRLRLLGVVNLLVVVAVVAGVGYLIYRLNDQPGFDENTLCPYDTAPPEHTVVVIDKTDAYNVSQSRSIAQIIRRVRDTLPVGARISLFELDARGRFDLNSNRAFSLCNPGSGAQANILVENPRLIQERYDALFAGPLEEALGDLITPRQAPRSPILEALAGFSQTEAFGQDVTERRVVLISDMLQNSDAFSVYGAGRGVLPEDLPDAAAVADDVRRTYGQSLRGVTVEVRLIARDGWDVVQRGALRDYWTDILRELGARVTYRDL